MPNKVVVKGSCASELAPSAAGATKEKRGRRIFVTGLEQVPHVILNCLALQFAIALQNVSPHKGGAMLPINLKQQAPQSHLRSAITQTSLPAKFQKHLDLLLSK
jgi:hypothetical protein